MTFRYYLRHCLWGLVGCDSLVYNILTDLNDGKTFHSYIPISLYPYIPYIVACLTIDDVAYPLAYYALEYNSIKDNVKKNCLDFLAKQDH